MKFLAISGSLRGGSFNSAALGACEELAPAGVEFDRYDRLGEIPPYDEDVRARGLPAVVEDLRERIRAADALLIATPEYNYSIPGVLKNAIDWASRPPDVPFARKSVGLLGASPGMLGTARAQYHLRQCFVFLNAMVLNRPEVFIGAANTKFDASGRLTDQPTRTIIAEMLEALRVHTVRLDAYNAIDAG